MAKAKIIKFPKPETVLECWCGCEVFFLHLEHGPEIDAVTATECAECGYEIPMKIITEGGNNE